MDVPFPLAWTWTRSFSSTQSTSVRGTIELLAEALRREGAKGVTTRDEALEFECPGILGMRRMALLAPISGGSIALRSADQKLEIKYQLQFVLVFWFSLAVGVVFALLSIRSDPLAHGVLAFSWLYFVNIAISLLRFPRFLAHTLANSSPPNISLERTRGG